MASPTVPPIARTAYESPRTLGGGYLFGIPLKDMGWFASLLMGAATGFMAFFLFTFIGIVCLLASNAGGHHPDYAVSYKYFGLPAGVLFGAVALAYLGTMWVKRQAKRG